MQKDTGQRDASIFIVADDYQIIEPDYYDSRLDGKGYFVMVTNDLLNNDYGEDNTIYLYKSWNLNDGYKIRGNNFDINDVISKLLDMNYTETSIKHFINILKEEFETEEEQYEDFQQYVDENLISRIWQFDDENSETNICNPNQDIDGEYYNLIWQVENTAFKSLMPFRNEYDAKHDLNGWRNTQKIMSESHYLFHQYDQRWQTKDIEGRYSEFGKLDFIEQYAPATFAANDFKVRYEKNIYNGYLPALGQISIVNDNKDEILKTMQKIGSYDEYRDIMFQNFSIWSSTQFNDEYIWVYNCHDELFDVSHKYFHIYDERYMTILPLIHLDF